MGYRAYPEYQESGLEVFGRIPTHWETHRLNDVAELITSNVDKKSLDNQEAVRLCNYVDVYKNNTINSSLEFMVATASDAEIKKFLLHPGDVIITKDSESPLDIGIPALVTESAEDLLCGYHLTIIRPQEKISGRFLYYSLQALTGAYQFTSTANGVTRFGLTTQGTKSVRICVPMFEEQIGIADHLDHKTAKIDRLIEKKQELIEKLQEQRATTFTQAVTKGLDRKVALVDSGLEWLGEIPAHWKVAPLRRFIARMEQGWSPSCEDRPAAADEWAVLKSGCINGGIFRESEHKTMPQELDPPQGLEVRPGDVLMCRASGSRHLIGSAAQVKECREKLIFSDKTYRITVDHNSLSPEFFTMAMRSKYMREQIELSISGAEGLANNIPQSLVKSYIFAVPTLEEQNRIVEKLAAFSERNKEREQSINEAIDRLQEYRTALITAAVTGQIDVRDWQAPASVEASEADKEVA